MTIPSPTLLHFRGGREAIDRTAYPDMAGFYADLARIYAEEIADLAAAGCRYLQIDETNFAYLCDPALRQQVQSNIGEDPATLPLIYAKLLNQAIAGRPKDMAVCIHICRGNNQSAWVAEGGYEPVAEALFNAVDVDGYFLEYDSPRAGDFAPLRYLPKGKIAVLGLVTTKLPQLESKDELKRRIDEAARYAPFDQLALSPQCGFASVAQGNKITLADEIAKLTPRRRSRARGVGLGSGPASLALRRRFAQGEAVFKELSPRRAPSIRLEAPVIGEPHQRLVAQAEQHAVRRRAMLELGPARHGEGVAAPPGEALAADDALAAAFDGAEHAVGGRALAPCRGARGQPLHCQAHGRHGRRLERDARPVEALGIGLGRGRAGARSRRAGSGRARS